MGSFKTTNIRISEDCLKALKYRAVEEGKSVAQLIREAIDAFLGERYSRPEETKEDPLDEIVGMFASKEGGLARNHDQYLYSD